MAVSFTNITAKTFYGLWCYSTGNPFCKAMIGPLRKLMRPNTSQLLMLVDVSNSL